jgi:flagellar biosynthesis anti-sigma factor FlgM
MKIEGQNANLDPAALQRLERAASESGRPAAGARPLAGDSVQVSSDAALANEASRAVAEAPEVRQDLVERMRALLEAGELGNDADALAESLISAMEDRR